MRDPENILADLRRISLDNHRCFGCGREHNCSLHGCAIIREASDLIRYLSATLTESERARSDLGKRLAAAQKSLHETKSEMDGAVREAEAVKVCAADLRLQLEAMEKDLAACIDCCDVCKHAWSMHSDCDCECESCLADCACKGCKNGSKFEWRGLTDGEA